MRNLLRCRRGSAAFATVVALVPLIGVVALGAEAGSWYVTKQHAQNAADAAAYSGGLKLACEKGASAVPCDDMKSVDYRAKQFAAQNAFCNAGESYIGCPPSLPSGVSQSVTITPGANTVQATVTQTQKAYLAALLGVASVTIGATAVAKVDLLAKPPCVLALKDPITFQGSATVASTRCGVSSNSVADNAIGFKGNSGLNITAPSYTVGGCSQTGGNQCTLVQTYVQPTPDPLSSLRSAIAFLSAASFSGACPSGNNVLPTAYDTTKGKACVNSNFTFKNNGGPSNGLYQLNGVYFFSGTLTIQGGTITTYPNTATLILIPGSTLKISGQPTIQITAPSSVASTQVPSALASDTIRGLMKDLLIYDPEQSSNVNITGNLSSYFNGTVYVPNSPVTYSGNSSVSAPSSGCYQLIAYAVTFSGNTKLDNSGCASGTPTPQIQTVRLVPPQ